MRFLTGVRFDCGYNGSYFGRFLEEMMMGFLTWFRGLFGEERTQRPDSLSAELPTWLDAPMTFADVQNAFALALYGQLFQRPGNLFISPFSISTALAMACAGARGETADEMSRALRFTSSEETLHLSFAELLQRLNAAGGGEYEMAVANSLWGQEGAPLRDLFLEHVAMYYGGGMNVVDFRGGSESARAAINRWVEEKTRQRIRNLIPPGGVDIDSRLVLVNAVYFKGRWWRPFHEAATRPEPFHLEGGGKVQAPLMHQQVVIQYMAARDFQAVDLDYRGDDLSMLVLLPNKKGGLRDLEKSLSERMLKECVRQMRAHEVKLFLPRFRITWGTEEIGEHLRALGMRLAFARFQADFSGINGQEPPHEESLFISAIFHKTFVEVNEEGTEAAAATAVATPLAGAALHYKPPPIPVFRADHPFLFAIRDRRSGTLLFLGRVADPTRES